MKMVAASKLRRAQEQAEAARPYAERMERMLRRAGRLGRRPARPRRRCWSAPASDQTHLLIAVTADRGLAGAFNSNIGRATRTARAQAGGRGQDGQDPGRRPQGARLPAPRAGRPDRSATSAMPASKRIEFADAAGHRRARHRRCWRPASSMSARSIYNRFHSVITQVVDRAAADPAPLPARAQAAATPAAARDLRVRAGRGDHPRARCCRRTWRSRSIARCWKAPPASTARG